MAKQKTNLSLEPELLKKAKAIMKARDFGTNLTGFIETLIREEWERRHGPVMMLEKTVYPIPRDEGLLAADKPCDCPQKKKLG
jgi:hypothetical protein